MTALRPSGTVTFLFTDIEGSTRLWDEHPEVMRVALARHDEILRTVLNTHDGPCTPTAGDSGRTVAYIRYRVARYRRPAQREATTQRAP